MSNKSMPKEEMFQMEMEMDGGHGNVGPSSPLSVPSACPLFLHSTGTAKSREDASSMPKREQFPPSPLEENSGQSV